MAGRAPDRSRLDAYGDRDDIWKTGRDRWCDSPLPVQATCEGRRGESTLVVRQSFLLLFRSRVISNLPWGKGPICFTRSVVMNVHTISRLTRRFRFSLSLLLWTSFVAQQLYSSTRVAATSEMDRVSK